MIIKAKNKEVIEIHTLLNKYAKKGLILPRSLSELYDHLRDLFIYIDEKSGKITGICAIHICWNNLAEIRSLVVNETHQKKGIGSSLIKEGISETRKLGINRFFVLTYVPRFFQKMGFKKIEKSELPQKIWADCIKCPYFPDCGEVALILDEGLL
ncbi:MAG: N-acetyltransferase [Thermodesulfobacteriota bacterium]|nr:N-acetyltransferase [Thermodesulfobacteriota bacterium]